MQTECARCRRVIDTVQGYKFGPNQYLCMPCYDQFKAERLAKAKKQHKNPLVEQFGKDGSKPAQAPAAPPTPPQKQPPTPQMFQPKSPPKPQGQAPAPQPSAPPPSQPQPSVETCDICKKPLDGFRFPLQGGKKVCLDCNNLLREVAKSLILNVQCPHCGKDIQLSQK